MSNIASLFNVPDTDDELSTWSFSHAAHHRDIAAAAFKKFNVTLLQSILDPFDPSDQGWFERHQAMHFSMNLLFGIASYNLEEVNWDNQDERNAWIYLNGLEHRETGV